MESFSVTASADPREQPGGDYNIIPYISIAIWQSQPSRLAALATLFGLSPPNVETARVLELGCASGGNLIPLAARFPNSRFLGIDLSVRHVADGQRRSASLGLTNVEIRQGDLTEFLPPREAFDYIICHGVYSWVPPPARQAILRICHDGLSANGVAYISYNVYPGWQMRKIIRDIMLYHAGDSGPPSARISQARWVLEQMAKFSQEGSPYGATLRQEASSLAKGDDAYILGEFLAPDNAPCYFQEFVAAAERHDLVYLCESELHCCLPENRGEEFSRLVRTMSDNKLIPLEQYSDFFSGRRFRQTLLVKAANGQKIQRMITPNRASPLHVACRLSLALADSSLDRYVFRGLNDAKLETKSEVVRATLEALTKAFPETRSAAELTTAVKSEMPVSPGDEALILQAVYRAILSGMIVFTTVPVRTGLACCERPSAWSLARADALSGVGWTATPHHSIAAIDGVCAVLLPLLDGTHDRDALKQRFLAAVREGRIDMRNKVSGKPPADGPQLIAAVSEQVDLALERLAAEGLLAP